MKHIIIEGCDRTSKSTLVEGLCKHFKFDNVTVRHFAKPPKGEGLEWQMNAFEQEGELLNSIKDNDFYEHKYYENILIWNRSHIGEYVFGPLYRKNTKVGIKLALDEYEKNYLEDDVNLKNTYLIYLYADAKFLNDLEDGNSFSNTIEQKQRELFEFEEAIEFSIIPNKLKIKVCDENQKFYTKEHILNQVIEFIK